MNFNLFYYEVQQEVKKVKFIEQINKKVNK